MSIQARLHIERKGFRLQLAFELPEPGITAIFGPSGCGKTTLLRSIAGLEPCKHGYLNVNGQIWQDHGTCLPTHQRAVGYVFQEPSLFPHLTVQQNIDYARTRSGHAHHSAMEAAIALLHIDPLLSRYPTKLSGGEQQRVAIARALATAPELMLLDEPLAALDEQRKADILPCLRSIQHELNLPMLYVSHSRHEVAQLADHMLLLENGQLQASDTPAAIFSRLDLPLAHSTQAETIIHATVTGYDDQFGLNQLAFSGGQFVVAGKPLPAQQQVRLQILARDVSITLQRQSHTSILNIFAVTVDDMVDENNAQMTLRLQAGHDILLARITRKSASELDLKPGDKVFAQVKSVALLI